MEKDTPDAKQVQAESHATQSKLKAVQKINEELSAEANEAKKAGLGTRPLMTRLMRTARASQGTLVKLIKAIADYQLTHDEKAYLHSLAEGNDEERRPRLVTRYIRNAKRIPGTARASRSL